MKQQVSIDRRDLAEYFYLHSVLTIWGFCMMLIKCSPVRF